MSNSKQDIISFEDLRPYIKLLVKSGWLMILMAGFGYGWGRLITHRQVNLYRATSEILLNQGQNLPELQILGSSQSINSLSQLAETQNQLRILKSYDLIGRAIDKIDDPLDLFLVGRVKELPVGYFSVLRINVSAEMFSPQMTGRSLDLFIESSTTYKIVFETDDGGIVEISAKFGDLVTAHGLYINVSLSPDTRYDNDRIETAKIQHFRIRVFSRDQRVNQYRLRTTVDNVDRTSIVTLKCEGVLASKAKQFLDTLAFTYINYTVEARRASNLQTENFIDNQLNEVEFMTDSLVRLVDFYRDEKDVIDLTKEQAQYFEMLIELEKNRRTLNLQLESLNSLHEYLSSSSVNTEFPPTSYLFIDDQLMIGQMSELFELQARRSSLLLDVKEGASSIRRVDSASAQISKGIKVYLNDYRRALMGRKTKLNSEISDLETRLSSLPRTQREILALERKLSVNDKLSLFLLERKAATIIARANINPEASLIEKARYGGIVGPNKNRTILTFALIGFVIGFLLAMVRLLFFAKIESTAELREVAHFPVIGGIPLYKGMEDDKLAVREDSRSNVTEAFRSLKTNLQYLLAKEESNVVLVSSLHPEEGKSFVVSNLASILSKGGKRVVVVDFDLHKPRIHEYFHINNKTGVSDLLLGKHSVDEVRQAGPYNSLDIITAGPIPANASDLILSDRLKSLLAQLKSNYDYVIIDTPPILLISDGLVLMEYVDTALLVTHTRRSSRRGIKYLEDMLSQNHLGSAAFVLNGIRIKPLLRYYNKYAVRYGYLSYSSGYTDGFSYGYKYGDRYDEDGYDDE